MDEKYNLAVYRFLNDIYKFLSNLMKQILMHYIDPAPYPIPNRILKLIRVDPDPESELRNDGSTAADKGAGGLVPQLYV